MFHCHHPDIMCNLGRIGRDSEQSLFHCLLPQPSLYRFGTKEVHYKWDAPLGLKWTCHTKKKKKKTSHITEALNWPVRQFTSWNAADSQPQQVFLTSRLVYAPDPPHYTKCTLAGHTAAGRGVLYHPQQLESSKAVALLDIGRYSVSGIRLVFSFFRGG